MSNNGHHPQAAQLPPIILVAGLEPITDQDPADVAKAVEAGVLYACPHAPEPVDVTELATQPCGLDHAGPGFYHLAEGKTLADYEQLVG